MTSDEPLAGVSTNVAGVGTDDKADHDRRSGCDAAVDDDERLPGFSAGCLTGLRFSGSLRIRCVRRPAF